MTTEFEMLGRRDSGWITCGPVPGISKLIVFAPGFELESRIACRSEPGPESSVLVTVKAESRRRCSMMSKCGRCRRRPVRTHGDGVRTFDRPIIRLLLIKYRSTGAPSLQDEPAPRSRRIRPLASGEASVLRIQPTAIFADAACPLRDAHPTGALF